MSEKFEQISLRPGFMKHNGGVLFRNISDSEYEFKCTINENNPEIESKLISTILTKASKYKQEKKKK